MNHSKISKIFLLLAWSSLIFTAIGLPMPVVIDDNGFTFYDKAIHIVLFAVFAHLVVLTLKEWRHHPKHIYWATFLISFFFIWSAEIYQTFVPGRSADPLDLLAGLVGVSLAIFFDMAAVPRKLKPKLLLHVCCIGCGAYVVRFLENTLRYKVTLFFYDPNIFPREEYIRRLEETKIIAKKFGVELIEGEYDHERWRTLTKGHENDPEKGERCSLCYEDRLEKTAALAKEKGFACFSTTLTVSPHKNAQAILSIGKRLEEKYGVQFLDKDFKKQDGYKKATALSKELGLYRQDYCGCEFSLRDRAKSNPDR